jgi:hypothetical protein
MLLLHWLYLLLVSAEHPPRHCNLRLPAAMLLLLSCQHLLYELYSLLLSQLPYYPKHKKPVTRNLNLRKEKNPQFRNIPDIETKIMYGFRRLLPFPIYSAMIFKTLFAGFTLPKNK